MTHPYTLRIAKPVAAVVGDLAVPARRELRQALLRAQEHPYAWPSADRYDLDDTVRVVTTAHAIVHYAIVPATPHLWAFAITVL
ncbi:hypothetical protein ACIRBX_25725 [Kitasatospora sp. NPDC096147]|uniref:hypothetical protein n=1 Tax=Kitasatospora sp. NPDC096147 TaxID=3364093 RepID=UPI0037F85468